MWTTLAAKGHARGIDHHGCQRIRSRRDCRAPESDHLVLPVRNVEGDLSWVDVTYMLSYFDTPAGAGGRARPLSENTCVTVN
jgi:hypothetical protein